MFKSTTLHYQTRFQQLSWIRRRPRPDRPSDSNRVAANWGPSSPVLCHMATPFLCSLRTGVPKAKQNKAELLIISYFLGNSNNTKNVFHGEGGGWVWDHGVTIPGLYPCVYVLSMHVCMHVERSMANLEDVRAELN